MDKLQFVQNAAAAARLVSGTWKYERGLSTLMHDDLRWLVIPQRVQYKLAVTVHRCLRTELTIGMTMTRLQAFESLKI